MNTPNRGTSAPETQARQPVYYLSHGGGSWPYISGSFRAMFQPLEHSLRNLPSQLPAPPRAVLVVRSHGITPRFAVSTGERPGMIYDYGGFPEEMYRIHYPAPGSPDIAAQVADRLEANGWKTDRDAERGFDHGTYSLLKPIYPDANMPVVQLSLREDMNPHEHFAIGQALAPLRDEGVLILGSGQSFHNLGLRGPQATSASVMFDRWLHSVMQEPDAKTRHDALMNWEYAPAARLAHPSEDHLIPLMVVAGAAREAPPVCVFRDYLAGVASSAFRFGGADQAPIFTAI